MSSLEEDQSFHSLFEGRFPDAPASLHLQILLKTLLSVGTRNCVTESHLNCTGVRVLSGNNLGDSVNGSYAQ